MTIHVLKKLVHAKSGDFAPIVRSMRYACSGISAQASSGELAPSFAPIVRSMRYTFMGTVSQKKHFKCEE